jgi:hypothetical protein
MIKKNDLDKQENDLLREQKRREKKAKADKASKRPRPADQSTAN